MPGREHGQPIVQRIRRRKRIRGRIGRSIGGADSGGERASRAAGVRADRAKAAALYRSACDGGFELACGHLAALK